MFALSLLDSVRHLCYGARVISLAGKLIGGFKATIGGFKAGIVGSEARTAGSEARIGALRPALEAPRSETLNTIQQ